MNGFAYVLTGPFRRLIHLGHQAYIGAADMGNRLPQRTARQDVAVAEYINRIHEQNIHIAFQLPVLITIVKDSHLGAKMIDRILSGHSPLCTDEHRNLRQMLGQHKRLVAGLGRTHVKPMSIRNNADLPVPFGAVTAVQYDDPIAHIADITRKALGRRRLSRSAYRHIAETDHITGQLPMLEKTDPVTGQLEVDQLCIDLRKHIENRHDDMQTDSIHLFTVNEFDEIGLEIIDLLRRTSPLAVFRTAFVRIQHLAENDRRFARRSFVFRHDSQRLSLHAMTMLRIVEQADHFPDQLLLIPNRDAGVAVAEQRMCILEVKHIMTDQNRLAMGGRLQNIMPAVRNQAAADIDDVADAVNPPQFANGIENDNIFALRRMALQRRARRDGESGPPAKMQHLLRAQQFTRRNDQSGMRVLLPHSPKGMEHKLFLSAVRGTGQKNAVIFLQPHLLDDLLLLVRAHIRIRLVKFRISRHRDQFRRSAEAHDIIRIDLRLHGKSRHRSDHIAEQAVQMAILLDTPVADSSVDHHDRNMKLARRLQEIRPKLRFNGQKNPRMNAPQHMTGQKRKVQRKIDNGIRIFYNAVCHLIAAGRHNRDQNRRLGKLLAELPDQRTCRHNLPDRCRMNPDAVFFLDAVQCMSREKAQTLPDPLHKALFTDRADHEYRYDQDDDQYCRYIVKDLHCSVLSLLLVDVLLVELDII